ncbi:MAG: CNNM domain-containing protein, partial [Pseudomonadota bacterium]
MELALYLTLAGVVTLLSISAFFSGSETALTAVSRARMHAMAQEGDGRAALVSRILKKPERIIGTVLLGNNLVNILASALTTSLLITLFGEAGVLYATIVLTLIIVIFCEVLPKTYAIAYPEKMSLAIAPIMRVLIVLLRPITATIDLAVQAILSLTPTKADDDANVLAAKEELRGTIELSTRDGAVERADAHRLGGVLDLKELTIEDVMIHRTKMETLDIDAPAEAIVRELLNNQHTRLPVWRDEPDNIVGVLHAKDVAKAVGRVGWDVTRIELEQLASKPWFVPETTSLSYQLNAFLKEKAQIALAVDEYGEVRGLLIGDLADDLFEDVFDREQ